MASSDIKKSPVHIDKRTPEDLASAEEDHCVLVAFKKLKLDAEGLCVKKAVDQCKASLKHKSVSTATSDQGDKKGEEEDFESWSQSFQGFCLCDRKAFSKRGKEKWRAMCHYHQLHMRKDGSGRKNKLNLVRAVRDHRPLLQESRLKVIEEKSDPQVMRSARFNFSLKSSKQCEEKGASAVKPTTLSASASSKDSTTPTCEKTSRKSAAASQSVFAERFSERVSDFSALSPQENQSAEKSKKEKGPSFYTLRNSRGWCDRSRGALRQPDNSSRFSNPAASPPTQSSGAAAAAAGAAAAAAEPAVPRTDVPALERTCSQEARIEEVESNVNELISLFDHYFILPKKMSSMAEMMYA